MDLTPERMKQIEDEEQQRLSEEKYRAEVGARLRVEAAPTPQFVSKERSKAGWWIFGLFVAVIAVCLLVASREGLFSKPYSPSVRLIPIKRKLVSGPLAVRARSYTYYRFTVDDSMLRDVRVRGTFTVTGGTGNDILAALTNEQEFQDIINGHDAKVLYQSYGKKTADSFDVRIATAGTYYLYFCNQFSVFSDKTVTADAELSYNQLQTY